MLTLFNIFFPMVLVNLSPKPGMSGRSVRCLSEEATVCVRRVHCVLSTEVLACSSVVSADE
jgi:hypothetical protein